MLFVDQPVGSSFLSAYSFPEGLAARSTDSLSTALAGLRVENVVIVVTGHGGHLGIDASPDIKPFQLLNVVKGMHGVQSSLIVLGQCFAGNFNLLDARGKKAEKDSIQSPDICLIGATGLTVSLSGYMELRQLGSPFDRFVSCNQQWYANVFLLFFMSFVCNPIDIDGDGLISVTDAYKFAGILTNENIQSLKQVALFKIFSGQFSQILPQIARLSPADRLAQQATKDFISLTSTVLNTQESWMLNAHLARKMRLQ